MSVNFNGELSEKLVRDKFAKKRKYGRVFWYIIIASEPTSGPAKAGSFVTSDAISSAAAALIYHMDTGDNKLVEEYLGGEEAAFSELVKKYLKPIYNFIFRLVSNRETAEDLTQEVFVKTWKNIKRYNPNKNFKTWLFAIAKNTTFDWLKKKKEIPFSAFEEKEGNNALENISSDEFLPDEILERKNIAEELDAILQKLPPHYRAVLLLHYKEDFSLHEIAEILNESYNTIKSRHQRGLLKIKLLFSDLRD